MSIQVCTFVLFEAMDPVRFDVGYENINIGIVQQYWVLSSFGNCHSSYSRNTQHKV